MLINLLSAGIARAILGVDPRFPFELMVTYPLMALFIMLYAYSLSYIIFRHNIDHDSVAIPLIANNSDIFGTLYVVAIARLVVGA